MPRTLTVAALQAPPREIGEPLGAFAAEVTDLVQRTDTKLVIYPELHLFGTTNLVAQAKVDGADDARALAVQNDAIRASAIHLDSPRVTELAEIARTNGIWFIPGSIVEAGPNDELFNTAVVFSPTGELVASYRKIFPWRPFEPYTPGAGFSVFDIPELGRVGLSICYDAWYPEVTRQLGWMGAEVIVNVVKTTTPDRAQELVLARANSIVNQNFTISVNCAGPVGMGQSLVVDPEGVVIAEANTADAAELVFEIDFAEVERVRREGTQGINRMWSQFLPGEPAITLPVYDGRIEPTNWAPLSFPFADDTP